jgi:hypothetical protein
VKGDEIGELWFMVAAILMEVRERVEREERRW